MRNKSKPSAKAPKNTPKEPVAQPQTSVPEVNRHRNRTKKLPLFPAKEQRLRVILFATLVVLLFAAAIICYIFIDRIVSSHDHYPVEIPEKTYIYDNLTGKTIEDSSLNSAPIYCIQIPNGLDGARPQAGLSEASIAFEAIAEAGITRFAAIFKKPSVSAIGPIRSLRLYHLEWDTPFDCAITHAGGAPSALAALKAGGYRDLTENYSYMYRSKGSSLNRRWNNLFTSSSDLANYSQQSGHTSSSPKSFTRMTDFESQEERELLAQKISDYEAYVADPSSYETPVEPASLVTTIELKFGNVQNFNPVYTYDPDSNTYLRSYASGAKHVSYTCPEGMSRPTPELACGEPVQIAPSVVIAMVVSEAKDTDNYHEVIQTTGSGKVYIFQNGTAIEGTWNKTSVSEQIIFKDANGEEIKLAPGQTWISAIPNYGSVSYR